MQRILAMVLVCFCASTAAHDDTRQGNALDGILDCEHLPAGAVTRLPDAIQPFAALECAPNGQIIVASEGWIWRYPASYFDRPFVAAYAPMASRSEAGPHFYTKLNVEELSEVAARQQSEAFAKALPNYRPQTNPRRILRMVAVNQLGHRFDVYFPVEREGKAWGVICAPDCAPEMLFMIYEKE